MNLRDQIKNDVQRTFMNPNEFAERHFWGTDINSNSSRPVSMIVENFTLDGKPLAYAEGVSVYNAVVHVDPIELGYTPREGEYVKLDNRIYYINGVGNEFGIVKIIMNANVS